MRILVSGGNGQLAKSIRDLSNEREDKFLFADRKSFDLQSKESIHALITQFQPDVIINCGAYTAVDKAESEVEEAFAINEKAIDHLIDETRSFNSKIIHVSTDYVFAGDAEGPYSETDEVGPNTIYGKSKLAGEMLLNEKAPDRSHIIRTSWLYSEYGHNFLKTMLRLGKEKEEISVVNDQNGVPTYCKDLASTILKLIDLDLDITPKNRTLHFSNSEATTWFHFAQWIMELSGSNCKVNPVGSDQYPTPAIRPKNSVLNTERIEQVLDIEIRNWKSASKECLNKLMSK